MSELLLPNLRALGRRIRLGIVGGGAGSRIGAAHRYAARLDGKYDLVAGAFDIDPRRGRSFARDLMIEPERAYDNVHQLIERERQRADKIDVVAVVTPNDSHFEVANALVQAGFHTICEKPMTTTSADARALVQSVASNRTLMAVNYSYSGYPMVRQARAMCQDGHFGKPNLIQIEWAMGNRRSMLDHGAGQWRTDPARVGGSMVLAQIGTHAVHMAQYISGLEIEALSAEFSTFGPNREIDDNNQISMRFAGGARGALWTSYVAAGGWHGFRFRLFGDEGGFEWFQEEPNTLTVYRLDGDRRILTRAGYNAAPEALDASRVTAGQPEGFIGALANIYSDFAEAVAARHLGNPIDLDYPNEHDGANGVYFIDAAVASARTDGAWVKLQDYCLTATPSAA